MMRGVGIALQTAVILWLGVHLMRHRPGVELFAALWLAWIAGCMAHSNGLPVWRDRPFGDAYDIAALVFVALCWARSA